MAEKDKFSKEIEDQIQSLASDVYIHVEEKLTQLIGKVSIEKPAQEIVIEEDPTYLGLQKDYLSFQQETAEQAQNFITQISQLEQEKSSLEATYTAEKEALLIEQSSTKLAFEQQKSESQKVIDDLQKEVLFEKEKQQQVQTSSSEQEKAQRTKIENNSKELKDKEKEITTLNEKLALLTVQEQELIERLNIAEKQRENSDEKLQKSEETWQKSDDLQATTLIEQKKKIVELNTKLEASASDLAKTQAESEEHKKLQAEQQEKLIFLEDKVKQHVKTSQNYKQELTQLTEQQTKLKEQQQAEQQQFSIKENQLQQLQGEFQHKVAQLENKNQELVNNLITEQSEIKVYQKEIDSLKSQVTLAQEGQESILNRFNDSRDKQERDNDKVRETIKYLRDENSEMITQHNEKKEQFLEQIHELESKLTEYRLKFEYAQKQLIQNSDK